MDVLDLGIQAYLPVLRQQEELVERRGKDAIPDTLLLVEHEPVYTLGRNAKEQNIVAAPEELDRLKIQVVRTGRGGDVTFHGPGQLVGYPILDLRRWGKGVVWYVDSLEEVLIRTLAEYGVTGTRDSKHRGVWVNDSKIAAIGVRITRHITMHGFSLNVRTDLSYYRGIIPCGIPDKGVTSLYLIVPEVDMNDVKRKLVAQFKAVFGYE